MKEQKKDFKKLDKQLEQLRFTYKGPENTLSLKYVNDSLRKLKPKFSKKVRVLKTVGLLDDSISLLEKENRSYVKKVYKRCMNITKNIVLILEQSAAISINMKKRTHYNDEFIRITNNHIADLCYSVKNALTSAQSIQCFIARNKNCEDYSFLTISDIIQKSARILFRGDDDTLDFIMRLFSMAFPVWNKTPRKNRSVICNPDGEFGTSVRRFFEEMYGSHPEGQKSTDLKTMISSEKGSFNCTLIVDIEHVQKPFIEKSLEIYRDLCEELFMDVLGKCGVETLKQFALKECFKTEEIPALIYIDDDNYYVHLMDPSSGSVTSLKSYLTTHLWDGMKVSFALAGIRKSLYRTFYNKWSSRISIDPYLESIMVLQ